MSDRKFDPPRRAIWFLRHACPGDNEALTGDLIESFREGQTRGWFWRQTLIAFALGVLSEIQRHWPHFCYAIIGATMPSFLWKSVHATGFWLHWWSLPWPWSQLVLELSPTAMLALVALPVLAAGLAINREFRWISLFRTAVINLALLGLGHYLIDLFPWLLQPVPGDSHHRFLIIPGAFQMLLFFSTFLVSAWLGGASHRHAGEFERQAES